MGRYDDFFDDTPAGGDLVQPDAPVSEPSTPAIEPELPQTAPETPESASEQPKSDTTAPETDTADATQEANSSDTNETSSDISEPEQQEEASPVVPAGIADKPQSTSLKPRYQGDSEFSQMVAEDWFEVIKADPRSYQALLYRPANGTYGVVDEETGLESAPFTDMDNNQRDLTYEDPVIVVLRDSNDSREAFEALDDDSNQDGLVDDYLIVSIAEKGIPKGSILEWNEETLAGGQRRVWWYVNQIYTYGTQHVGTLYYCIPARTFDTTDSGKPL
ncbi:phage tail protein [Rosenbergiella collisarenosi]|uniref:phage tail protein n=1 Tax=Rosenbergiella collisarenosi TaxID=1544695 RepID=UPI001F4D71AC|nr:phage tail protein [Rosenbergiella collisarenosi]